MRRTRSPVTRREAGRCSRAKCTACHGADGQGVAAFPALWGPKSFSIGASMARLERAASFIQHNMPLGQGGTLSWQEAFDLSAYINSHPRPDSPGKEGDWPLGGAPADVPYATKGHDAFNPPPSLVPARIRHLRSCRHRHRCARQPTEEHRDDDHPLMTTAREGDISRRALLAGVPRAQRRSSALRCAAIPAARPG